MRPAIKRAVCELDRWADDILADGAFFGSHEDALAARLPAVAAGLVGALERHPEELYLAASEGTDSAHADRKPRSSRAGLC